MKLFTRTAFVFLTAFVLVTAAYAKHSDTDIAYAVEGGNIYFDKESGSVTDYDKGVTKVVIPDKIDAVSVTSIADGAFSYCDSLTSVEIPASVTSIGDYAFECCNMTSVEIPASVTSIGDYVFHNCNGLQSINVEHQNENYTSLDGVLFNKSQTSLICYPAGKSGQSYQIPSSVASIGHEAFFACKSLTSVEIPASVTSIGDWAFCGCNNLTSVEIPASVTSIGREAFSWNSLTSVEIPASVTSVGDMAFLGCNSLHDVYYGGSKEQWEQIEGLAGSYLVSDKITIHYNISTPSAPKFEAASVPTVNGHAISAADLGNLTEITVPVKISADTPVSVTVSVPFFKGGKFLGMGIVTATVDSTTQSVTVPVTGNVSGAEKLKVIFVDAAFRPLSAAGFDI